MGAVVGIAAATQLSSVAGVVLIPKSRIPSSMEDLPGNKTKYPESYFGQPPADPIAFEYNNERQTANEVEDRAPASLDGKAQTAASTMPENMNLLPEKGKGVQEVGMIAGDLGFFPKAVFVTRGIPVRMFVTGASTRPLCIMIDDFNIQRQVISQKIEEITFTPRESGTFRYHCPINGMDGLIVVKDINSPVTTAAQ